MENIITKVQKQIEDLKSQRRAELAKISEELTAVKAERATAESEIKAATEAMDFDSYEKAKRDASRADLKLEMLKARYRQYETKEIVSEEESDKVIASIKIYEAVLGNEYYDAITAPIKQLRALTDKYLEEIRTAENLMVQWTQDIHKNYRSETTTYEDGTNRSPRPVPVRTTPFHGLPVANTVDSFLKTQDIKINMYKESQDE